MRKSWGDREGAPVNWDSYNGVLYCCVEKVPSIKQCAPRKTHGSDYGRKSTGMCTSLFGRCTKQNSSVRYCSEYKHTRRS
jgi:hypothetical protein